MVDGNIEVNEVKFNEILKANDEHPSFSEFINQPDVLGEYQFVRDSIKWKIKFQELEKQNINTEELKGEMIRYLVRNFMRTIRSMIESEGFTKEINKEIRNDNVKLDIPFY